MKSITDSITLMIALIGVSVLIWGVIMALKSFIQFVDLNADYTTRTEPQKIVEVLKTL